MTVLVWPEWSSEVPDVSDDDVARKSLVDVTVLRRTCVSTWESVLEYISWHKYSTAHNNLWDDVLRTQVSLDVISLLENDISKDDTISKLLTSEL